MMLVLLTLQMMLLTANAFKTLPSKKYSSRSIYMAAEGWFDASVIVSKPNAEGTAYNSF